jgi:hypothetical protein
MTTPRTGIEAGNLERGVDLLRRMLGGLVPLRELKSDGPLSTPVRSITASATVEDVADAVIVADATSAPVTVTLPTAAGHRRQYTVKRLNSGANAVTVAAAGGETIDGAGTYPLSTQYQAVTVASDGTAWHVVGTV